jgi:hypothetical protein
VAEQRILACRSQPDALLNIEENPLLLHSLLISTYFSEWRSYLAHYEQRILAIVSDAVKIHREKSEFVAKKLSLVQLLLQYSTRSFGYPMER